MFNTIRLCLKGVISKNRRVGDVPVLVEEVIAIWKILRVVTYFKMDNLPMKNDPQIVINSFQNGIKVRLLIISRILST